MGQRELLLPCVWKSHISATCLVFPFLLWPTLLTCSGRTSVTATIVSLQPDTNIQKLLSNRKRIWIRKSETLFSIYRGFGQTLLKRDTENKKPPNLLVFRWCTCLFVLFRLLLITLALIEDDKFISIYGNTWKFSCSLTVFHHGGHLFCCCATIVIGEYCHSMNC